jgi:membrane protease YdiL (CAAX protease family)
MLCQVNQISWIEGFINQTSVEPYMELALLYTLSIWVAGLVFVIVLLIALESGYRVGLARRETWKDADSGGGAIVQTSMFALLGLLLAFTYAAGA